MQSTTCLCSHFLTVLLISLVLKSVTPMRPSPVTVNKCCDSNQMLNEYEHECIIIGDDDDNSISGTANSTSWWPLIVLAKKQAFFEPHGSAPRFMKFHQFQPTCEIPEFIHGPHKMVLYTNGSLYLSERHKYVEFENYCIDKESAIVCDPNAMSVHSKKSLKKCCAHNAAYKTNQSTCVPTAIALPSIFNANNQVILSNSTDYDVQYGFPMCKNSKYFTFEMNEFHFDGDSMRLALNSGQTLAWNEFCLENVMAEDNETNSQYNVRAFICADHLSTDTSATDIRFILFPIGLLISVVFLLATLATRYILPANHHILHWRCQTFHVATLLIGDLLLAFTQLFGRMVTHLMCVSIAVSMHFFFLSAFFWLNTMCFNIYISFRDFRPSMERNQERNRLRIYKIYAFGIPFLIAGIAAMRHSSSSSAAGDVYLQPRFCETEYWFAGNLEKLTYFYGPVGILLFINLVLFASTARQLTCGLWKREEVKSTTERTTLSRICIKLVVVMGCTWICDVASWAHSLWYDDLYYVWIITDLINTLQGVFIFIVIGCQHQVFNVLKQMWRSKNIQFRRSIDGGQRNSSSSQVASSMGESITNNTFTTSNAKISAETMC